MRLPVLCAAALLIALTARAVPAADRQVRTFRQVIDSRQAEYVIEVGGTLDPENLEITIENLGGEPVHDPWMTVNGHYDWFDIASMVGARSPGTAPPMRKRRWRSGSGSTGSASSARRTRELSAQPGAGDERLRLRDLRPHRRLDQGPVHRRRLEGADLGDRRPHGE